MGDSFGDNPWGNHEQVFGESNCVFSVVMLKRCGCAGGLDDDDDMKRVAAIPHVRRR